MDSCEAMEMIDKLNEEYSTLQDKYDKDLALVNEKLKKQILYAEIIVRYDYDRFISNFYNDNTASLWIQIFPEFIKEQNWSLNDVQDSIIQTLNIIMDYNSYIFINMKVDDECECIRDRGYDRHICHTFNYKKND